jgi:hypothetical protein
MMDAEGQPVGDSDPDPAAEASPLAADVPKETCIIGRRVLRPLGLSRVEEMKSDQVDELLARGIALPGAVYRHARDASRRLTT